MIEQYLDRLAFQFSDSENLKGLLSVHLLDFEDISLSLDDLLSDRYLDTAQGVQLDGIGEIVGLVRPVAPVELVGVFGFLDDPTAQGFSKLSDPDLGGNFVSLGTASQPIGDDLYRTLLRVKIKANKTAMTNEDVIDIISFAFNGILVRYILITNTKPTYEIGKILTQFEMDVILPLIPVMIGIDEADYKVMHNETPFGFSLDDTSLGFGTLADANIGGNFAKFI